MLQLHELKQQLPSRGQEVVDAKERIAKRLEVRKSSGKEVTAAAHEAATSPENDLEAPTEAQKESGNYKKGHVKVQDLDIAIENPAGSKRRPEWPTLKQHYGYIKGTVGADSEKGAAAHEVEQVDVFVNPDKDISQDNPIFIIDQSTEDGVTFDEHKIMMGFDSEQAASEAYLANYTKDWKGLKQITQATQEEFKTWLDEGDTSKEYSPDRFPKQTALKTKEKLKTTDVPRETKVKPTGEEVKVTISKDKDIITEPKKPEPASKKKSLKPIKKEPVKTKKKTGIETIYRGELTAQKKGGKFYSPDKSFAKEFTQSGQEAELIERKINRSNILYPETPVFAGNAIAVDAIIKEAKEKGFGAVQLNEGKNQPPSIFIIDDSVLVDPSKVLPAPDAAARAEPEQDPYAAMNGKEISYEVEVIETGETYTVTVDAGVVMKDLDARAEALQRLKGCI